MSPTDPKIYAKPWTAKLEGVLTADTELIEYVCAENEKDRTHLVGKQSDDTKNAVKLAANILSKYVGAYEFNAKELGIPGPEILTFKVVLKDGALEVGVGDGPKMPMTPLSETTFNRGRRERGVRQGRQGRSDTPHDKTCGGGFSSEPEKRGAVVLYH